MHRRPAPLHRQRRGRRAPRRGAARAPHRLRPRPAGPGAEGLLGAARAEAADRQSRRGAIAGMDPGELDRALPASGRRSIASPGRWRCGRRSSAPPSRRTTTATPPASGLEASDGEDLQQRLLDLPGIGPMKARSLIAILGKRFGDQAARAGRTSLRRHPTLGDVDSVEALVDYQAKKRAHKAAMRAAGATRPSSYRPSREPSAPRRAQPTSVSADERFSRTISRAITSRWISFVPS